MLPLAKEEFGPLKSLLQFEDLKYSIYIPNLQKGDTKDCRNQKTILEDCRAAMMQLQCEKLSLKAKKAKIICNIVSSIMKKADRQKCDSFEMRCQRRVLQLTGMRRKTKMWLARSSQMRTCSGSKNDYKQRLSILGHIMRRKGSLNNGEI